MVIKDSFQAVEVAIKNVKLVHQNRNWNVDHSNEFLQFYFLSLETGRGSTYERPDVVLWEDLQTTIAEYHLK